MSRAPTYAYDINWCHFWPLLILWETLFIAYTTGATKNNMFWWTQIFIICWKTVFLEKNGVYKRKKNVTTHIYIVCNVHTIFNKNELEANNMYIMSQMQD